MSSYLARVAGASLVAVIVVLAAPTRVSAAGDHFGEFECFGQALHILKNSKVDSEFVYTQTTQHYCLLPNGKKQGWSKVVYVDFLDADAATITLGKYANDKSTVTGPPRMTWVPWSWSARTRKAYSGAAMRAVPPSD